LFLRLVVEHSIIVRVEILTYLRLKGVIIEAKKVLSIDKNWKYLLCVNLFSSCLVRENLLIEKCIQHTSYSWAQFYSWNDFRYTSFLLHHQYHFHYKPILTRMNWNNLELEFPPTTVVYGQLDLIQLIKYSLQLNDYPIKSMSPKKYLQKSLGICIE